MAVKSPPPPSPRSVHKGQWMHTLIHIWDIIQYYMYEVPRELLVG